VKRGYDYEQIGVFMSNLVRLREKVIGMMSGEKSQPKGGSASCFLEELRAAWDPAW
jgi:hypothetical protein